MSCISLPTVEQSSLTFCPGQSSHSRTVSLACTALGLGSQQCLTEQHHLKHSRSRWQSLTSHTHQTTPLLVECLKGQHKHSLGHSTSHSAPPTTLRSSIRRLTSLIRPRCRRRSNNRRRPCQPQHFHPQHFWSQHTCFGHFNNQHAAPPITLASHVLRLNRRLIRPLKFRPRITLHERLKRRHRSRPRRTRECQSRERSPTPTSQGPRTSSPLPPQLHHQRS